ncbi:outer membrane lipoprotein carrier protein LolA [Planctomycetota bacterium]
MRTSLARRGTVVWMTIALAVTVGCSSQRETSNEAIERLARAYDAVKDVHLETAASMAMVIHGEQLTRTDTSEVWLRRDGEVLLYRVETKNVQRVPWPGFALSEITTEAVMVIDGEFSWLTAADPMFGKWATKDRVGNAKSPGSDAAAMGLMNGLHVDLRERVRKTAATCTLEKIGRGTVLGRSTTIIETTLSEDEVLMLPVGERRSTPVRSVMHFDDTSGFPLAVQAYTLDGTKMMDLKPVKFQLNGGVSRKLFTFTPPEDYRIIDKTKDEAEKKSP